MASISEAQPKTTRPRKRKRDGQDCNGRSKRQKSRDRKHKTNGETHDANHSLQHSAHAADASDKTVGQAFKTEPKPGSGLPSRDERGVLRSRNGNLDWKMSRPMGGRMMDIDPILTEDERHLVLTYNTSIQIYTTEDSLLVRRIPVPLPKVPFVATSGAPPDVVATRLSQGDPSRLWVAFSNGYISQIDWTNGTEITESFRTVSSNCMGMALLTVRIGENNREVVFASERLSEKIVQITAYDPSQKKGRNHRSVASSTTFTKQGNRVLVLESSQDGLALFGSTGERLFTAFVQETKAKSIGELKVETYVFDASDIICSMDMRVSGKGETRPSTGRMDPVPGVPVVDLLAGGARGGIYLYHDLLAAFSKPSEAPRNVGLQARKYHWHRRAVHSVKWSRDGNYMISGGSENSLVLWQRDTGKQDFLPHLSGGIENIVVSPRGASYAVHLDDNSVMVLSTAELKPTVYVAGLQSAAAHVAPNKDILVDRVWGSRASYKGEGVTRPAVAAINPLDPSKLHVCIGSGHQMMATCQTLPAPWLQTFDLETFRTHSRHAIARTQTTGVNMTSKGYPIVDPTVTHCAFSTNGKWMATVDEWEPSALDIHDMSKGTKAFLKRQRREVHLKFWEVSGSTSEEPFTLVSRINSPHATTFAERIYDLCARRDATMFATVGGDGVVRLWRPKMREQNGVPVKDDKGKSMHKWACSTSVDLGLPSRGELPVASGLGDGSDLVGSLAFSEDGSTLFVAFGDWLDGVIHAIDTRSGLVRHTMQDMWRGSVCRMVFVSPFLVTLSDKIRVYDVVGGEMTFTIGLPPLEEQSVKKFMIQLAADHASGVCAVVVPSGDGSDIAIFQPESDDPLFMRTTSRRITGLVTAAGGGFLVLDDGAQLYTISSAVEKASIKVAQPLEDINLHSVASAEQQALVALPIEIDEDDGIASDAEDQQPMEIEVDDDDGGQARAAVIGREKLADVFDGISVFAMPPVEELFYRVVGLVAALPLEAQA